MNESSSRTFFLPHATDIEWGSCIMSRALCIVIWTHQTCCVGTKQDVDEFVAFLFVFLVSNSRLFPYLACAEPLAVPSPFFGNHTRVPQVFPALYLTRKMGLSVHSDRGSGSCCYSCCSERGGHFPQVKGQYTSTEFLLHAF